MTGVDWSRATVLTAEELRAAWTALGLGAVPLDLEAGVPDEEAAEYAVALGQLRRRQLADDDGPIERVAGPLRVLATAPLALDLRLSDGLVTLAAMDGEQGALLLIEDTADPGLYLLPVTGPQVPAALVRLAGELTPGTIGPVSVAATALDAARAAAPDGGYWDMAAGLTGAGVAEEDAHLLALMCTGITSAGQFFATARHGDTERPSGWVLAFHRGAAGDFLQLRRPSGSGLVTVGPVTAAGLLARLDEMVADLAAGRPRASRAEESPPGPP